MPDNCCFALHLNRGEFALAAEATFPNTGMTGVFGPSGSGKTTLLRSLAGLEAEVQGLVRIRDRSWLDSDRKVALPVEARRVGFVFQDERLFPHLDVAGNLAFAHRRAATPAPLGQDRIAELLGIGHLRNRRVHQLSGGEARRVAIARALVANPDLLLLDEPLSGLDAAARESLLDALAETDAACPVPTLFVSHDLEEIIRLCDHLIVVERGRVLRAGPLGQLLGDPQVVGRERYGVLLAARVAGYDEATALSFLDCSGLMLRVPGRVRGDEVRVRVLARDVSICLEKPARTSVLNVLSGVVAEIVGDGAEARVTVNCGSQRLLAQLSQHSVAQLGLQPGRDVYAQVKGAAVRPAVAPAGDQENDIEPEPGSASA